MKTQPAAVTADRHSKFFHQSQWILFFLLIVRLLANWLIPINDTTEARYAEIARKMLETGNWLTPMIDYGKPFLAKPPLSFWLSALSMKLFGVNAFAARLPALLLSIGVLCLIWQLAKTHANRHLGMTGVLVLASCVFFFINAGAVMTDAALLFSITLIMVSFWLAVQDNRRQHNYWGLLFFTGLGLGLLAKGPLAVVLPGLSIFIWTLQYRQWRALWQKLPWIKGSLLTMLIALPWYILEETKNPGFLNYFIIGEHINRFLHPGWQGDQYGYVHAVPHGMIWIYLMGGIFPWIIPAVAYVAGNRKLFRETWRAESTWFFYLLWWILIPLLFFTLASNIIYPYCFPCLPPFALIFASLAEKVKLPAKQKNHFYYWALLTGMLFLLVSVVFVLKPELVAKSQKPVIQAWLNQHPAADSQLIYWNYQIIDSAQFYSHGRTKATVDVKTLQHFLSQADNQYIVVKSDVREVIPQKMLRQLQNVTSVRIGKNQFVLYRNLTDK